MSVVALVAPGSAVAAATRSPLLRLDVVRRVDAIEPFGTVCTRMPSITPVPNVEARISAIRQRFSAAATASTSVYGAGAIGAGSETVLAPTNPLDGFDPFGQVYQEALKTVQVGGSAGSVATLDGTGRARLNTMGSGGGTGVGGIESDEYLTMSASEWMANGVPGSSAGKVGGFGPMPVPEELAAFGNGQIPDGILQPIGQGGHKLYAPAADQWKKAVAAAKAEGIDLEITDSYRSYDQQVDLVRRKGLYSQGGYGAVPGTSNHGWGLAVDADVTDPATLSWMKNNAYKYGYVESVPREPWHWEFRPHQA